MLTVNSAEAIAKAAQVAPVVQPVPAVALHGTLPITMEQFDATYTVQTGETIKLGQICARLGFTITADFLSGLGFEPWAQKLAKSAGYKGITVAASQGIKTRQMPAEKGHHDHQHHDDADPHAWQNPLHVITYVRNISAALSQADPAGTATYQRNTEAYVKELQALDQWTRAQLTPLTQAQRKVITSHDAFGYLAAQYQISFLAPQAVSTDSEPSAKDVASLIRQIKRDKVKAVFVENMSNPKLLAQLAKDAGVTVGATLYVDALSGPTEPGATYLKMMTHNVRQLVNGMRQN